jgi:hypothetical protein
MSRAIDNVPSQPRKGCTTARSFKRFAIPGQDFGTSDVTN